MAVELSRSCTDEVRITKATTSPSKGLLSTGGSSGVFRSLSAASQYQFFTHFSSTNLKDMGTTDFDLFTHRIWHEAALSYVQEYRDFTDDSVLGYAPILGAEFHVTKTRKHLSVIAWHFSFSLLDLFRGRTSNEMLLMKECHSFVNAPINLNAKMNLHHGKVRRSRF